MRDYFYEKFPSQFSSIATQRPNGTVRGHILADPSVIFFGGADWKNVAKDLNAIPMSDRSRFVFALFMVVLTDQALYAHFRDSYDAWRRRTNFPKFGWSGFGPHNENPFKILWAPEREGLIDSKEFLGAIPEFVRFFMDETTSCFRQYLPEVDLLAFFNAIKIDSGYTFHEGEIVSRVKEEFELLTNG